MSLGRWHLLLWSVLGEATVWTLGWGGKDVPHWGKLDGTAGLASYTSGVVGWTPELPVSSGQVWWLKLGTIFTNRKGYELALLNMLGSRIWPRVFVWGLKSYRSVQHIPLILLCWWGKLWDMLSVQVLFCSVLFCSSPVSRATGQDTQLPVCSGYISWSNRLEDIFSNECLVR